MKHITTVIIGAGQSGLAMSFELAARNVDHLIIERGKVGNSWRTDRWDSLRLLTPNWMNNLAGAPYMGKDLDGFMHVDELVAQFDRSAAALQAPVMTETTVLGVSPQMAGYRVVTDQGTITCDNLIIATGATSRASRPGFAADLPDSIAQFTPLDYKRASDLPPGKVLVVGASASGAQLAREIRMAGHDVTLSVGEHVRVPRNYRDADVLTWMEITGRWSESYEQVADIDRQRRLPSLQLSGSGNDSGVDLNALQDLGIELVGRMAGLVDGVGQFSGSLANVCALADLKMDRLLAGFDVWANESGLDPLMDPAERPDRTRVPASPRLTINLVREGYTSVVWATGYRPDHRWLRLPVFDRKGQIRHKGGVIADGLFIMGLPFLRRRKSTFIDGAADDVRDLADHLVANLGQRTAA